MQPISYRKKQVQEMLFKVIVTSLHSKLADQRLRDVSVTKIKLNDSSTSARIYFSISADDSEQNKKDILKVLKKAKGKLRHIIAKTCELRIVPELHFHYDDTKHKATRVDELLAQLRNRT
ncbi:MAG: ribosome-binding factor A [Thiotrichales bacterium]|nr:MAG: ribosome-binding factor A [Thiotrichales bacterium]